MIRNLIFDLGGVLLNYDIDADTRALAEAGLPEYARWPEFPELGEIANRYLNGLMSDEEFCAGIDTFCAPGTSDETKFHSMQAVLADIPRERLEALVKLKERYKIYLLSNINHLSWEYSLGRFEEAGISPEECFDRMFLSYEMGMAKPDAQIYRKVLEETCSEAGETMFFDDNSDNVAAAAAVGIKACKVPMNSPEEILRALIENNDIKLK